MCLEHQIVSVHSSISYTDSIAIRGQLSIQLALSVYPLSTALLTRLVLFIHRSLMQDSLSFEWLYHVNRLHRAIRLMHLQSNLYGRNHHYFCLLRLLPYSIANTRSYHRIWLYYPSQSFCLDPRLLCPFYLLTYSSISKHLLNCLVMHMTANRRINWSFPRFAVSELLI